MQLRSNAYATLAGFPMQPPPSGMDLNWMNGIQSTLGTDFSSSVAQAHNKWVQEMQMPGAGQATLSAENTTAGALNFGPSGRATHGGGFSMLDFGAAMEDAHRLWAQQMATPDLQHDQNQPGSFQGIPNVPAASIGAFEQDPFSSSLSIPNVGLLPNALSASGGRIGAVSHEHGPLPFSKTAFPQSGARQWMSSNHNSARPAVVDVPLGFSHQTAVGANYDLSMLSPIGKARLYENPAQLMQVVPSQMEEPPPYGLQQPARAPKQAFRAQPQARFPEMARQDFQEARGPSVGSSGSQFGFQMQLPPELSLDPERQKQMTAEQQREVLQAMYDEQARMQEKVAQDQFERQTRDLQQYQQEMATNAVQIRKAQMMQLQTELEGLRGSGPEPAVPQPPHGFTQGTYPNANSVAPLPPTAFPSEPTNLPPTLRDGVRTSFVSPSRHHIRPRLPTPSSPLGWD